jgi:hypothetical protein
MSKTAARYIVSSNPIQTIDRMKVFAQWINDKEVVLFLNNKMKMSEHVKDWIIKYIKLYEMNVIPSEISWKNNSLSLPFKDFKDAINHGTLLNAIKKNDIDYINTLLDTDINVSEVHCRYAVDSTLEILEKIISRIDNWTFYCHYYVSNSKYAKKITIKKILNNYS